MADIPLSSLRSPSSSERSRDHSPDRNSGGFSTPTARLKNVAFSRLPSHRYGYGSQNALADPYPAIFHGPPPPIARSVYASESPLSHAEPPRHSSSTVEDAPPPVTSTSSNNLVASISNISSIFFDTKSSATGTGTHKQLAARPHHNPDSIWRRMQRQEKSLSQELQAILDMQAQALTRGLDSSSHAISPDETHAQSSGSNTPTGDFYSRGSASLSKSSQMAKSLHQPNAHGPGGVVLPVRQPRPHKSLGLKSARKALSDTLSELRSLKQHENRYIKGEIQARIRALSRAERLTARQLQISTELGLLENNDEEELAQELFGLEKERDDLSREIQELEERLILLRNKRRWVDGKIMHVRGKREAGLSGYRGALKEVGEEINNLVRQPPVEPLQSEAYTHLHVLDDDGVRIMSPGGDEFLALVPERRTLELARAWWETEIRVLEARNDGVDSEIAVLEEGAEVWAATAKMIGEYESSLSQQMKQLAATDSGEKVQVEENTVDRLVAQMDEVTSVLRQNLQLATEKKWNLLICAIGAELEAFEEAGSMLRLGGSGPSENEGKFQHSRVSDQPQQLDDVLTGSEYHQNPEREDLIDTQDQRQFNEPDQENRKPEKAEQSSKFKALKPGLASPLSAPYTESSESLPSPAFKPYHPEGDGEYSDNEVPADFLA
ncbi:hypothetical protein BROUX41_002817 [Berkeleyomyces rouxiae]|uniref:uncharacterized protein n=1 Tax=Berkeleyomyces rouxiae TaxID=2035830 RepID=UPI003B827EB6